MRKRSVLSLRSRSAADAGYVGAKAAGINRLMVAGFPVPQGFVILPGGLGAVRTTRGLGPGFHRDLKQFLRHKGLFAVRPSLPDGGEAVLGLTGEEAVTRAVARCMAAGQGSPGGWEKQRPVIVQRLVDAVASGQAFSCNPETGDPNELVITGGWGIGRAAWLEGKTDRFRLRKYPLLLSERAIAAKDQEHRAGPVGMVQRPLDHALRLVPCLTDPQILRLGRLVRAIEEKLGWPVRVEWAMASEGFYLLQLDRAPEPAGDFFYLTPPIMGGYQEALRGIGISEVPSGLVSPWAVDFFDRAARSVFRPVLARAGLSSVAKTPPLVAVAGRLYLNESNLSVAVEEALGLTPFTLARPPGAQRAGIFARAFSLFRLSLHLAIRLPAVLGCLRRYDPQRLQVECETIQEEQARLERICREGLRPAGITSALEGIDAFILERLSLIIAAAWLAGRTKRFLRRIDRWCGPNSDANGISLFAGLGGMESAEAGLMLWDLARKIKQDPNWSGDLPAYLAGLSKSDAGREISAMIENFTALHGHRCRGEYDLATPRLGEDPAWILAESIPLQSLPPANGPTEATLRQAARRSLALAWIEGRLSGGCRRLLFWRRRCFKAEYSRLMEAHHQLAQVRSELARLLWQYRRILLMAGKELAARGRLAQAEDVFLLRLAEIIGAFQDEDLAKPPAVLARRAEARRAYAALDPPARLSGCFIPPSFPAGARDETPLRGIGVSPGKARGFVRLIGSAQDLSRLVRGEILVARNLDAGCAPRLLLAGALVTEFGDLLSEQAVLAREYGLPAIVGAAGITDRVRTGDFLEIDGHSGLIRKVELFEAAQAAAAADE